MRKLRLRGDTWRLRVPQPAVARARFPAQLCLILKLMLITRTLNSLSADSESHQDWEDNDILVLAVGRANPPRWCLSFLWGAPRNTR